MEKERIETRIAQKIEQIEEYLDFLDSIVPEDLEEYKRDLKSKAACERYAEKTIEALIDLTFFVISFKKLPQPIDEETIFEILSKENIISEELAKRLNNAKGMRNFIIHRYGEIDDDIVFNSLKEELIDDARDFIKSVGGLLK